MQFRVFRYPKSECESLFEPARSGCRRFGAITCLPRSDQFDVVSAREQFLDHKADGTRDAVDFRGVGFRYDRNAERCLGVVLGRWTMHRTPVCSRSMTLPLHPFEYSMTTVWKLFENRA